MAMRIDFKDVIRATLPVGSGNEGWIGVSPSGDDYHVVVPVDVRVLIERHPGTKEFERSSHDSLQE